MTKSLLLLLFLFPLLAFSQGSTNDYLLSQKPASGPLVVRPVTPAVGKLLGWPASINTPAAITLGTSLSITGTTLNAIPAWGDLTGVPAAITTLSSATAAGLALMDDADASAQRTTLGLGTLATQSGTLTDYLTTATAATTYQPLSATLTTLSSATAAGLALMDDADASAQRTTLGLAIGTDVQAFDSDLSTWAGVTPAAGVATFLATPSSANLAATVTNETGSGSLVFASSPTFVTKLTTPEVQASPLTGDLILTNQSGTTAIRIAGSGATTTVTLTSATASTIAHFNGSRVLASLPLDTYPSLTELSYVKGVTSAIQTQLTATTNASNISSGSLALARIAQGGATSGQALAWDGTAWAPATVGGGLTIGTTAITGGTSGRLLTSGTTVGELTLGTGVSTFLGTPSLANFNTALSDADVATTGANTFTGLQQFSGTTHAGIRLNNLTTAERDALTGAAGMAIWNTTDGRLQLHNGSAWTSGMVRLSGDTMTGALTITQATANTGILTSTGYSLTGSNATPMIDLAGTWNTSGTPTAIKLNITNTASNAASMLMDLQVGGVSRVNYNVSDGYLKIKNNDTYSEIGGLGGGAMSFRIYGAISASLFSGGAFNLTSTAATFTINSDLILGRQAAGVLRLGNPLASGWVTQQISPAGAIVGTTVNGNPTNNLVLTNAISTGTGANDSAIVFSTYGTNGSSGSAIGTLSERLRITTSGGIRINGDTTDTITRRTDIGMVHFHGQTGTGVGIGGAGFAPGVNLGSGAALRWTNDTPASTADVTLSRAAANTLQLGTNTATASATAVGQTLKGPNATGTTSTGGSLTLSGGTGTSAGGAVIITTAATTTQTERARFSSAGVTIGASGTAIASVISNTATLDFPSTSSHHSSDLTLTVTGAAVGDVVAIGIPNGSVGTTGVFFGWVSADDTVTIRYTNTHNGGAVDAASGTFRATVIKH
jgi:hypothetical protein